jgi:tRNA threonylcarbamoyl adenosine modification protein (Sua5/YciO/YrdC/YwlC family)
MGDHLYTYVDPPNQRHIDQIITVLRQGGVIALPTGTNWAFCCDATSKKGVAAIRKLKPMHPKEQPFSLICDSISMATKYGRINQNAYRVLNRSLPGHFTVILKSSRLLPKLLKNKRTEVGVRIPNEPITLEIVRQYGGPIIATSVPQNANGTAYTMGFDIHETHGHGVDLTVDIGGELSGEETTILDLTGDEIVLVRQGAGHL